MNSLARQRVLHLCSPNEALRIKRASAHLSEVGHVCATASNHDARVVLVDGTGSVEAKSHAFRVAARSMHGAGGQVRTASGSPRPRELMPVLAEAKSKLAAIARYRGQAMLGSPLESR